MVKLLSPKSINLEPRGGIPDLTSEDISHALGTIRHPHASLVLRVKLAGQETYRQDLFIALYTHVMENMALDWPRPRNHWIFDLTKLAVSDFLAPALCPTCNGLGSFNHGQLKVTCEPCLGTGRYRHIIPEEVLHIRPRTWRTWEPRYLDILGKLSLWESIACNALGRLDTAEN